MTRTRLHNEDWGRGYSVEAEATFLVLSAAEARSAIGTDLTDRETRFVKD